MKKAVFVIAIGLAVHASAAYHIVRHIPIGGVGGWDYLNVDSAARRLYVSHSDRVEVIDIDAHKVVGTITGLNGVHGIAIAADVKRGFISNGRAGTMTIFDLDKLTSIKEVKTTGDNPDAILYDPATKHVWTFNGRGQNATAFDTDGNVLGTVPMGGKPEFAQSDNRGHIYVNIEDKSEIAVIDAKGMKVDKRYPLAPCESPSGLAIDAVRERLFSVCENKTMAIVGEDSGRIIATVPIGGGVDGAAADNKSDLAFSSNGADGTITVVNAKDGKVVETVPTARGARTIAFDEKTHHLFVPTAKFGETPAPTAERPRPRPAIIEGSFEVIEVEP
ncbi:MAG TPA: YncE family protein [Thermoanaerobaculia bacterium]|nr:YncE family protein [Thermoanaerobaculia bacterium]